MSSLAEAQIKTCEQFAAAYSEWTAEALLRTRTDDCLHAVLPASLGRPEVTNELYAAFFQGIAPIVKNLKMTIQKIINSPEQHMAVMHTRSTGETPVGPYANEYAWFLYFTDDGKKVKRIEEFLDSAFAVSMLAKLEEYKKSQEHK